MEEKLSGGLSPQDDAADTRPISLMHQADHENPLKSIMTTAMDAVIVMDTAGYVVDWSDVASEIFGWIRTEAVGSLLCDLIIPYHLRDAHRRGLETFLRSGVGPVLRKRIEVTALHKDGTEFPVELSITPFAEKRGLVFVGFVRDITERKRAARRLERQTLQAKLLYKAISFAAEAPSFEAALRNCLAAIQQITGWPVGHVYLPSEHEPVELLPSNIWLATPDKGFDALKAATSKSRFALGEGLPGTVMQTGEPLWISDVRTDVRFLRAKKTHDLGVTSAIGFPIKNATSIIAIVEFFTPVPTEPDPDLLLMLRSIGDQVGRVFERRRAEKKLQEQSDHQKLLLAELNHRVKNMLTVVSGIAAQTMRSSSSMQEFNCSFLERLNALSRAHSLLAAQNWGPTPLKTLINQMLAPYSGMTAEVSVDGPAVDLSPKPALAISLVLHELVTNAAKYGALSREKGRLSIRWQIAPNDPSSIKLMWCEIGVTNSTKPTRAGFGTRLIKTTVKNELNGEVSIQYQSDGLRYDMDLRLVSAISFNRAP